MIICHQLIPQQCTSKVVTYLVFVVKLPLLVKRGDQVRSQKFVKERAKSAEDYLGLAPT